MVIDADTFRDQLIAEVADKMACKTEIRVFLSAWDLICNRFNGISSIDEILDPVPFVHNQLASEIQKNGMVTEEVFISWFLNLPFLKKNLVDEKGNVWSLFISHFMSLNIKLK